VNLTVPAVCIYLATTVPIVYRFFHACLTFQFRTCCIAERPFEKKINRMLLSLTHISIGSDPLPCDVMHVDSYLVPHKIEKPHKHIPLGLRMRRLIYKVIHKSLRNFRTRLRNNQDRHSRKDLSSTCKVEQKLAVSLPLLTRFPSA
jgi:hypothetical protein